MKPWILIQKWGKNCTFSNFIWQGFTKLNKLWIAMQMYNLKQKEDRSQ